MSDPVPIYSDGILYAVVALVDHLATLEVTDRGAFAAHLRSASVKLEPGLGKQILALADGIDPKLGGGFTIIDGGKQD